MKVFLYEFITGGGLFHSLESLPDSLLVEGRAMISALAADFLCLDDCEVVTLRDSRQAAFHPPGCDVQLVENAMSEQLLFRQMAKEADWTVVIAPESDGVLLERVKVVEDAGGRLLGPSSPLVELASDKVRTAEHLAGAGVPVPVSVRLEPGESLPSDFSYPAVIKPVDGAGSVDTFLVSSAEDEKFRASDGPRRLEQFYSGLPASVAVLCGPAGLIGLPACRQDISEDGRFEYLGGSCPLGPDLAVRAKELAIRAVGSLSCPVGYLGVDLVLGNDSSGCEDVVIEINPRLTTSYVGLRAAIRENLAGRMVDVALGRLDGAPEVTRRCSFRADGAVL